MAEPRDDFSLSDLEVVVIGFCLAMTFHRVVLPTSSEILISSVGELDC